MNGVEEKCDKINCKVCEYFLKFVHFCKRENRFINRVELEEREKKWESSIHNYIHNPKDCCNLRKQNIVG